MQGGRMPVVVFDANVLIPLIVSASSSARLFLRLRAAGWAVAASPQILLEVADKLRTKESLRKWLDLPEEKIELFLGETIMEMVSEVPGHRQAHGAVPADPKDDIIIAAALEADAEYIISEDKHLIDLGDYQGIKIMNREEFEAELDRLGVGE